MQLKQAVVAGPNLRQNHWLNTLGTRVGPGGPNQTLAVKNSKFLVQAYILTIVNTYLCPFFSFVLSLLFLRSLLLTHIGDTRVAEILFPPIYWSK